MATRETVATHPAALPGFSIESPDLELTAPASGAASTGEGLPLDRDEAFALVCRHVRTISRLQGPELEDMIQIAAEQVLKRLDSFEGRSAASTWIFRICYNVFLNQRRLYRRWLRRFTLTTSGELPQVSYTSEAATRLEWHERSARLHAALDAMSPKLSTVVALHDLKDLSIDEIAVLLEIKARTARSRLRNGRLELRRRLAKDSYFSAGSSGVHRER